MTKFPPTDYDAFPGSAEHPEGIITPSVGMTQRLYLVAALLTGAIDLDVGEQPRELEVTRKRDLAMVARAFRMAEWVCNEDDGLGRPAREAMAAGTRSPSTDPCP